MTTPPPFAKGELDQANNTLIRLLDWMSQTPPGYEQESIEDVLNAIRISLRAIFEKRHVDGEVLSPLANLAFDVRRLDRYMMDMRGRGLPRSWGGVS